MGEVTQDQTIIQTATDTALTLRIRLKPAVGSVCVCLNRHVYVHVCALRGECTE